MASGKNSKADSQSTNELKFLDNQSLQVNALASIPWNQPPLSSLTSEQKSQLQNQAQVCFYGLGEKIWSTGAGSYQFFIFTGKVRLREEKQGQVLETLQTGDWFGDLCELAIDYKAVAASKEVILLCWDTSLWAEVSASEMAELWLRAKSDKETKKTEKIQERGESEKFIPCAKVVTSSYPFISDLNTGAACLTMVAQYLEHPVNLEWVQRQLRGQSPKNLVEAGEKLGLVLRKLRVGWDDLRQLSFPVILRWQPDSSVPPCWVVAYGMKKSHLIVANPLNDDYACDNLPRSVVESAWDGRVWQVELISHQEKFNLGWFTPAVWKYRKLLGEVLLGSFTLQLLGLGTPLVTQVIIDKVMVQQSLPTLDVMAMALLLIALFEAMLGVLRLFIFTHTARRLDLSLSAQLFRHLMRLPLAYFESRRVGDTIARVQELEQIRQFLTGTALTVILDSIFAVVYLVLMFYYNIQLTFVALAVLPLFAALTMISTPILRNWLNETFNRSADSQSFLVETVTGIHSVKAHGAEPVARERWEGLFARFVRTGFKASTTSNISSNIGNFLTSFSSLLILWFGAKLVIEQNLTIGQLVAFQMLSGRVTGPLLRLVQLWQNLQQVLLSVDRIGDILNVAPEAEVGTGLVLPPLKGQISFEQIFFRYQPHIEPVLKGISFKVEPGQFVGIVGRSGSGKSTLSKLLQRLYQIESGRILIDGFDIKSADLASLRQQISVVLQEDFLFNGSILENISFGNSDISAEEVVEAARLAVAHDFISQLPYGYETNVGERGTALSGGQRQRIALARLFLSQAPILILDEATSALDSETEQQVLQNLQKVSANRTVFLIAHRFAPLKGADLILVLEKGMIAERGTHLDLLQQKGLYWSLYQRQQANI
ncbi:type I secretion system permease/ATPase [Umezakia ovalisporum]|jgi:ATP-binding cassette subfamily B protein|uniref:Type I secretion system permease/ATPase n=1 Tax=Umezakia ovalisporum FSS-43 TaxID=2740520 RepID=A0ABT6K8W4_9CYAN|nr:type I secretion system permease/ATPase [Umezakia ovalisporum]MBI1242920.1 type I secretion system permease/ATPase [Nostoc sp. RI_552]MDH6058772.1 type I secretion system permease/ATPase [Umezakia ovalisporum FSS-43]MDH6072060.1 type I secretion system permease/ATPase [Umezakia ovalisporum CobakiLakeA]MDH6075188.1 type I secretion system permease/ATPase [Umezakia ovalisporum CS-1034]MDH6079589.1 type I secretion system permease/ATPase [Umezakia ovalisporum FSS-45]